MNKTAEMWVNIWYIDETDITNINHNIKTSLEVSEFNIIGEADYVFSPQGYTKTFLLSESHCALHTWPEINKTWLELASCNKDKLDAFTTEILKVYKVNPISMINTIPNENF